MASNSETGIEINITNWKFLIDTCSSFGTKYNPSNDDIKILAMNTLYTTAKTNQQTLIDKIAATTEPVNNRQILYDPLNPLVTRVMGGLTGTKASSKVKADAKTYADDIRGYNKPGMAPAPQGTETGNDTLDTISQSHMSFVRRAESFRELIALLKTVTLYTPNEADLKTTALEAYSAQLDTANEGIGPIIVAAKNAAFARNRAVYAPDTGIVELSKTVKAYVKSVYGANGGEYKLANGIKFRGNKKAPM